MSRVVCFRVVAWQLAVVLVARSAATEAAAQTPDRYRELDRHWREHFISAFKDDAVGFAWVVQKNGQPVSVGGHGWARAPWEKKDASVPMTADTRMAIGSITKPLTAVALLRLIERRDDLSLDQAALPFLKHRIKKTAPGVEKITLQQLMQHRSGLKNQGPKTKTRWQRVEEVLNLPMARAPGGKREYNNRNYLVVRSVLERAARQPYDQFMQQQLLRPMGVRRASLLADTRRPVIAYRSKQTSGPGWELTDDFTDLAGAGGWYFSARELAMVLHGVRTHKVLSAETTKKMFREEIGWFGSYHPFGWYHQHGGGQGNGRGQGYSSQALILPDGVDIVLLCNTNPSANMHSVIKNGLNTIVPFVFAKGFGPRKTYKYEMTSPQKNVQLRYTSDGSEPTAKSALYTDLVNLPRKATVKCKAFRGNVEVSFTGQYPPARDDVKPVSQ